MHIAIAGDHNSVSMKTALASRLAELGHEVDDRGVKDAETVDYPPLCEDLCRQVADGHADRGIMIGGTGSGEAMACNKINGIRASLCADTFTAEIAAAHNLSNVLVIGAKVVTPVIAERIVETWLTTPFKGGVHQDRVDQIGALERGESLL